MSARPQTARRRPRVYIARAVDDRPRREVDDGGQVLTAAVEAAGFETVDPVAEYGSQPQVPAVPGRDDEGRVLFDLSRLHGSDALLADVSIPGWVYVGCICEIVYSRIWDIPAIVVVGDSPISQRMWLRYHATALVPTLDDAIAELTDRLLD